jgi:hypothetical protein
LRFSSDAVLPLVRHGARLAGKFPSATAAAIAAVAVERLDRSSLNQSMSRASGRWGRRRALEQGDRHRIEQ